MEIITLIGTILGGLGLFLLAIDNMTDGLKYAAGASLRAVLSQWSKTPLRGIFSGCLMTAVVQSSSAVTVASLGFVNAGLISVRQALGIIYGANVGTTMTGWLVALIGFKMNIQAFALPLIGIGVLMKLIKPNQRVASLGLALVGFGLFFVGIDILKEAFEGIVKVFDISQFTADGITGVASFLLIGIVMTILTQSSSAAIALTITAASTGMIGLYAAGAMVIGANIGTTSTALLATIGATSNAKRVGAAQVIFNAATAIVALLILPVIFNLIDGLKGVLGIQADPAIALALFHTIFNLLGVLLIYPQNDRLAKFLESRFKSWEEQQSHPRYLDKTIAQTPDLAVNALVLELQSIAQKNLLLYSKFLSPNSLSSKELEHEVNIIKLLSNEVSQFIVSVESSALSNDTSNSLATLMRVNQYFLTCALSIQHLAEQAELREALAVAALEEKVANYFNEVHLFLTLASQEETQEQGLLEEKFRALSTQHDKIKAALITAATHSEITIAQMSKSIDCLAEGLRIAQQWFKAFSRINVLESEIHHI
ncbi:MAG: Na/Pi cotransporter family protein [Gammaproteobacteria bacterium]|nr:Na/Pi cotransporter family protein [Gammaproteobacteria bacterium]